MFQASVPTRSPSVSPSAASAPERRLLRSRSSAYVVRTTTRPASASTISRSPNHLAAWSRNLSTVAVGLHARSAHAPIAQYHEISRVVSSGSTRALRRPMHPCKGQGVQHFARLDAREAPHLWAREPRSGERSLQRCHYRVFSPHLNTFAESRAPGRTGQAGACLEYCWPRAPKLVASRCHSVIALHARAVAASSPNDADLQIRSVRPGRPGDHTGRVATGRPPRTRAAVPRHAAARSADRSLERKPRKEPELAPFGDRPS